MKNISTLCKMNSIVESTHN